MSRRRKKPHDPAEAARHAAERAEAQDMIRSVSGQPSTAVNVDPRTGRLTGAWRLNCFNTLLSPGGLERAAVDWLDDLVRTANGENGGDRRPDHIRGSTEGAPGQNVTDAMIEAGKRLQIVSEAMAPAHARMLFELLKPDADLLTRWREVVSRCTGETHSHAQAAAVRSACTSLVWIKDTIGRLERDYDARRMAA